MDIVIELLIAKKDKLTSRLNVINDKLNSLGYDQVGVINNTSAILDPVQAKELNLSGKSIQNQALEVLKQANRFLHKSEIADIIKPFNKDRSEKQLDQRLAVELGKAKKKDILTSVKYSKSNQSYVWGSVKWIDENKNIKQEHMYIAKKKESQESIKF
ncbi:hypothetical protein ACFQZJ_01775 [Maribacter chungangensis]|uniref:Uncharacterized protein n=1 Tax=Maribacter chungangensis TaxID=1069117 RepID=A0ABW3AYS0_9FLAO